MNAANYLTHPEFAAFCNAWHAAGRCPLPFADWLREHGLDGQADAAEWAATLSARDRCYASDISISCYVTPMRLKEDKWLWNYEGCCGVTFSHDIPKDVFQAMNRWEPHLTFSEAVTAFLDAWATVRAPQGVPL